MAHADLIENQVSGDGLGCRHIARLPNTGGIREVEGRQSVQLEGRHTFDELVRPIRDNHIEYLE